MTSKRVKMIERDSVPIALLFLGIILLILAFVPGTGVPPGNQPIVRPTSSMVVGTAALVGLVMVISAFIAGKSLKK